MKHQGIITTIYAHKIKRIASIACGTLLPTYSSSSPNSLIQSFFSSFQRNRHQSPQSNANYSSSSSSSSSLSSMDWQWDRASSVLLQNCDLPPPLKLFTPFHKQNNLTTTTTTPKITKLDVELEAVNQTESTSLLRALRLSQSRAREAEKTAAAASASNEQMAALILEESLRLSAHRRWVRLLEMEILLLQKKKNKKRRLRAEEEEDKDVVPALTWCLTLALCLGIGFALGRYMF